MVEKEEIKDWIGNGKSVFRALGANNLSDVEREKHDYYATDPKAMELLLELETFNHNVLEPSCGEGHLSKVLEEHGYNVTSRDLIDRGFGEPHRNFLTETELFDGDIITNPPYKYAQEFVEKSLSLIPEGNRVAMFLKIQFLESKSRRVFFDENPPEVIYVSSSRIKCAMNGDFEQFKESAVCYCWFIWRKGFHGNPIIKWFN